MPTLTIYYDEESDIAYFKINDQAIALSKVIDDDRWVDYAKDGAPVGLQLFQASKRMQLLKEARSNVERELIST